MKKYYFFLIVLVMTLVFTGCNESESTSIESTEQQESIVKAASPSLFWRVENAGNIVYLLGSIHIANESFYPLKTEIEQAFEEANYLSVEADVRNINEEEFMPFLMEHGVYQDGTTIKEHLDEDTYQLLADKLAEKNMDIELVSMLEPWVFEMLLTEIPDSYDENLGIDMHFLQQVDENQQILELESVEMQLMQNDNYPPEVQQWILESTLQENSEQLEEGVNELAKAWKSGELEEVEKILMSADDGSEEYDIYMELMLDQRNKGMVDKIDGYLADSQQETYFVIVGAAHFVGDNGINQLLEDKGYTVETVIQ